jgi:DNA-binding MarR family transcriptional regulator
MTPNRTDQRNPPAAGTVSHPVEGDPDFPADGEADPARSHDPRPRLAGAGPALFRLVRFWSRRGAAQVAEELTGEQRRIQDVQVLEAVDTAMRRTAEVSVTDVAHQLGIDRSGASRFIGDAVEHGYLRREPSTVDGRRAVHVITETGQDLLTRSHAWQDDKFAAFTAGWSREDAARFGGYLRRLADEVAGPGQ